MSQRQPPPQPQTIKLTDDMKQTILEIKQLKVAVDSDIGKAQGITNDSIGAMIIQIQQVIVGLMNERDQYIKQLQIARREIIEAKKKPTDPIKALNEMENIETTQPEPK